MSTVLKEQQECYHIIPCAISKEMREHTATSLVSAVDARDEYRVLIYIAQLTGPCVEELLNEQCNR